MNLILWRHAEAEDGSPDMGRALTPKGHNQARHVAVWLHAHMPQSTTILVSPAKRAQQTAEALDCHFKTIESIAPDAEVAAILAAAGWPDSKESVLIVGHQPTLGRVASFLLFGEEREFSIKKGGILWLSHRLRADVPEVTLKAAITPNLVD